MLKDRKMLSIVKKEKVETGPEMIQMLELSKNDR